MTRVDVSIPASGGRARGTLHVPSDGGGPWPGVLVFPDAGGYRETFGEMGDRVAGLGFVALVPDTFYRAGDWAPFDVKTLFTDEKERTRMFGLVRALTTDAVIADARAYADFLLARPEVTDLNLCFQATRSGSVRDRWRRSASANTRVHSTISAFRRT